MYQSKNKTMNVKDFAELYQSERDRAFRVLNSCKTMEQVNVAKNYFEALKQKWSGVTHINQTIKFLVDTDEKKFIDKVIRLETCLFIC